MRPGRGFREGVHTRQLLVRHQPLQPPQHLSAAIVPARISFGRSRTGPRARAEVSGAAPRPPELACWTFADNAGGASLRFPLVIFMLVKKASDLVFQLCGPARLTYGNGAFEKLPLGRRRQIIPLQKHRRPQALQDTLLSLRERQGLGAARFGCRPRSTSFALPSGKGAG
jgi:hypothetical protein